MKKSYAALAVVLALSAAQAADPEIRKGGTLSVAEAEAIVTVTKVDADARTVTFRGPSGGTGVLNMPAEAQNLDQVKPGQRYRMKYVEAIALVVEKGGKPTAGYAETVELAPRGANPGGVTARATQISAVIETIDYTDRRLGVRGPKREMVVLKAAEDVNLEALSAGDPVTITHTEGLALEMLPQE